MEKEKLNYIAFHITDNCSAKCPMCYEEACQGVDRHGNFEVLKKIAHNAISNGKVEKFLMVGGDPCEHPNLIELMKFMKEEGKKNNINLFIEVLSNTHIYRQNGVEVPMEEVVKYVDKLSVTVHGETPEKHDAFNGVPNSYNLVMRQMQKFLAVKNENQTVGIVVNIMPNTLKNFVEIVNKANKKLNNQIEDVCIQRIAPIGRAAIESEKYYINKEDLNMLMPMIEKIKEEGIDIVFCDCFPFCSIKQQYRYLLPKGGCKWGRELISVKLNGEINRCALSNKALSQNMVDLDTVEKWEDWVTNDPDLESFRNKEYLSSRCQKCLMVENCAGGCLIARQNGQDYLSL